MLSGFVVSSTASGTSMQQRTHSQTHSAIPITAVEATRFRGDIESMKVQSEEASAKYKALDERLLRYEEMQKGMFRMQTLQYEEMQRGMFRMQTLQAKIEEIARPSVPAATPVELQRLNSRIEADMASTAPLKSQISSLEGRVTLLETDYQKVVLPQLFKPQADLQADPRADPQADPQAEPQAGGGSMQLGAIDARFEKIEQAISLSDDGVLAIELRQHQAVGRSQPGVAVEVKQQVYSELPFSSPGNAQPDIAADKVAVDEPAETHVEHPIQESVWEAVVLFGLPEIGFGSSLFLLITLLLNSVVQGYICYVLMTSAEFNGSHKISEEVPVMNAWRNTDGHLDTYTNMFDVNLVSRVCTLDSSLSLASSQMDMLGDINSYLALGAFELELSRVLPEGPVLCMLCLSVFVTMMVREFREVAVFFVCLIILPRKKTLIKDNVLMAMSLRRLVSMFALSSFRVCISAALLYSGTMWLSSTTSIGDLILDAAALGFVMDIDELFFSTFVPLRVQCYVQRLEPLSCPQPRFNIDTIVCKAFICSVLVIAWGTQVGPSIDDMLDVKTALCGGSLNFIVASSRYGFAVTRLPRPGMGIDTAEKSDKATRAADELRSNPRLIDDSYYFLDKRNLSDVSPGYSLWCKSDANCLDFMTQGEISVIANLLNPSCSDLDSSSAPGFEAVFQATYEYWQAGGLFPRHPLRTCGTCAPPEPALPFHCPAYKHLCAETQVNVLVRMVCPVTCGCNTEVSGLYLAGSSSGCPPSCETIAAEALGSIPCEDAEVTGTGSSKLAWERYWNGFRFAETVSGNLFPGSGMPDHMISGGCHALSSFPDTPYWKPCQMTDSMKGVGRVPVRAFCPRTCCNASISNCLTSCKAAPRLPQ